MAQWHGKKAKVSFRKPEEPSFLKEFKKRVGYKEDHGVSDKFAQMPAATDEDLADNEEDLPQVVSSSGRGALSAEDCASLERDGRLQPLLQSGTATADDDQDEPAEESGKIVFRASKKRPCDPDTAPSAPTKEEHDNKKHKKKKRKEEEKKKKLLSFDDEEEEE